MEVASPSHQQSELLCEPQIFACLPRRVGTIVDFHTVETVGFELSYQIDEWSVSRLHPRWMR